MKDRIIIRGDQQRDFAVAKLMALRIDPTAPVEVNIKPYKKNRSLDQNNLLWAWYTIIGSDLGYDKNEIHEEMMRKHLTPVCINTPSGVVEVYSTKNLTTKEMAEYLTAIETTAGKMGIALPSPDLKGY